MYEIAKQAREKMKAKARSLAGEKDQKVDSSDWTPASPLNAEAKTGMRPISRRAYKSGGKVSGCETASRSDRKPRKSGGNVESDIGIGMANKNMKEANEKREGVKHIGGLKHGGKIARATGGRTVDGGIYDKKALGAIDPLPHRAKAEHYKTGGKVKKAGGGGSWLEKMVGKPKTGSDMSGVGRDQTQRYSQEDKGALNRAIKGDDSLPSPDEAAESAARTGDKHGGRIKRKAGGKAGHPDIAEDRSLIKKMVKKNALTGKNYGGRLGKAGGGALEIGGESKPKSKKGSKVTDIKINILAGGASKPPMLAGQPMGGGMAPPAGAGVPPLPPALAGAAAAPPAMPMGGMPGAPVPGLPGRKAGGRITKSASSYKDMEAGSANGEGRLQKTDIAQKHHGAPERKAGGRITKVAKSYKDMEAGAGTGEGRLQKEDIAKAKMSRRA